MTVVQKLGRRWQTIALIATFLSGAAGLADAKTIEEITSAAAKEGKLVWYDSFPREQGEKILAAFHAKYPAIKGEYTEVPGSQKLSRIMQESLAGGPTCDVSTNTANTIATLQAQGFVSKVDWRPFGIQADGVQATEHMINIASSHHVLIYNSNRVSDAEAPKTYEDLLNPKWNGRFGTWSRANGYLLMSPAWGAENTTTFVKSLATMKPRLYKSTYSLAEAVAAGEVHLGYLAIYHTALPSIQKGAPIKTVYLEPIPVADLQGFVTKVGRNPNAGTLFLAWLRSPEGALVYEKATGRGNRFTPGTETHALLNGKAISAIPLQDEIARAEELTELESNLGKILEGR